MRLSLRVLVQSVLLLSLHQITSAAPLSNVHEKRALSWAYGAAKVRGVNLGGWLVLEPWIKPSLFQQFVGWSSPAVDEYTFCQYLGYANAAAQLEAHWSTWYTESDFADFASYGLNHVRLPIGYWAFDVSGGEPFVQGQEKYLQLALTWASNHGLRVWIDLHGGPASQNGFDNSGQKGAINWHNDYDNIQRTLNVLSTITARYGNHPAVAGIELLNEPAGFQIPQGTILDFYQKGYRITQSDSRLTVLQDAFLPYAATTDAFPASSYQNVALDAHLYQLFSPGENARSHGEQLSVACGKRASLGSANAKLWTVVGEWSAAENDCAQWLNGFGTGARYDGSFPGSYYIGDCRSQNTLDSMSADKRREVGEYIRAQLSAYETASGWFFWTGKTESADLWNFKKLVQWGLMPQPLGDTYSSAAASFCNAY